MPAQLLKFKTPAAQTPAAHCKWLTATTSPHSAISQQRNPVQYQALLSFNPQTFQRLLLLLVPVPTCW
jgi:hypothetical protein